MGTTLTATFENHSRFLSDHGLSPIAVPKSPDPLTNSTTGRYRGCVKAGRFVGRGCSLHSTNSARPAVLWESVELVAQRR